MRNSLLLFTLFVFLAGRSVSAALVITEVMSSSVAAGGADWWELTNTGPDAVELGGYFWDDDGPAGNDGALFNAFSIAAGQSIIISDDPVASFTAEWGSGFAVLDQTSFTGNDTFSGLSSAGDRIQLWDADPNVNATANLVSEVTFPAAPIGGGFTFEWSTSQEPLGLSVLGENGAFASTSGNIGSPGTAVPEPSALGFVLLAGTAGFFRRKRR